VSLTDAKKPASGGFKFNHRRKRFGSVSPASLQLLRKRVPKEVPILGGPARIDSLDREIVAATIAQIGPEVAADWGIDVFDSDWLGTAEALYYVSPTIGWVQRWAWRDVATVRIVTSKFGLARYDLEFRSSQAPLTLITGRRSARRLITFHTAYQRYRVSSPFIQWKLSR
jgi:hypothetical protein